MINPKATEWILTAYNYDEREAFIYGLFFAQRAVESLPEGARASKLLKALEKAYDRHRT